MSELKFACPVCGQHIRCDSTKSGSQMECPTCFRKMVVPQAPASGDSKLVLSAAAVTQRAVPGILPAEGPPARGRSKLRGLLTTVLLILLAGGAAGAVYAFREKIFKPGHKPRIAGTNSPGAVVTNKAITFAPAPPGTETNWTLNLTGRAIPEAPATGQLNRRGFMPDRATVQGGTLTLRQGSKTPAEMSAAVYLFAKQGEDLAGQTINVDTAWTNAPKVTLRWKDEQQQPVTRNYREGYALKIQFGAAANGRLPGRIYLCLPDGEKSFVAGAFVAEIRKPPPPKPPRTIRTTNAATPKK